MSINEISEKVKSGLRPYFLLILTLLSGGTLFSLGRISTHENEKSPINVKYENVASVVGSASEQTTQDSKTSLNTTKNADSQVVVPVPKANTEVIGSKSGKKYYFPWCGTVKRIKPENQIHFASVELAKKAGFTPGGNCKGLQ